MKSFLQRLSPSMRLAFANGVLIALEGLVVNFSLLLEPSQGGGFMGFSAGRWGIIFLNLLALTIALFVIHRVWNNRTKTLETWLSGERHLFWLLALTLMLLLVALPSALGRIPAIRYFPYFGRIRPSLIWLALASGQVGLTLFVVLRQSILSWFRQFFPLDGNKPGSLPLTQSHRFSMLGIALVYLAIQWVMHLQVNQALWLPDSIDYIFPASNYGWTDPGLWTHTKPWGAAVLYKLTGSSPVTIDAMQTLLSALAWLALAWVISRVIRVSWLRVTAFALILSLSLAPSVQMWNHIIQSESLSISLMVLIISIWLSLLRKWRWERLFTLLILFGWWIGTRETNVYLSLMIAGILILVGLCYKRQRFYWAVSAALVGFCVINLQISELPTIPRWLYPLTNTVLHRILPNEEYTAYFAARGMPIPSELLVLSGGLANSENFAVFNDPALNNVEDWLYRKGKETYVQFLIDHPLYTLTSPWSHRYELLAANDFFSYAPPPILPSLGWVFENFFFVHPLWALGLLALTMTTAVIWARPWNTNSFWLIFIYLALFIPHFYLAWHGDAAEVERHAVQASVQLRLALWLLLLLALDKIVTNGYGIRTRYRS